MSKNRKNARRRYSRMARKAKGGWFMPLRQWSATDWPWERYVPLDKEIGDSRTVYIRNVPEDEAYGCMDMKAVGFYASDGNMIVRISDTLGWRKPSIRDKRNGVRLMNKFNELVDSINRSFRSLNDTNSGADVPSEIAEELGVPDSTTTSKHERGHIRNWKDAVRHEIRIHKWSTRRCKREIRMEVHGFDDFYMACGLDHVEWNNSYVWNGPLWDAYRVNSRNQAVRLMKYWLRKRGIRVIDERKVK